MFLRVLGYLFPCCLGGVAIHSFPYKVLMVPLILYYSSRCIVLLNKHYYKVIVAGRMCMVAAEHVASAAWSPGEDDPQMR